MLISIKISRNSAFLGSDKPRMISPRLVNVKMPTIVGIWTFMSRKTFSLSWVEHETFFITSGPGQFMPVDMSRKTCLLPRDAKTVTVFAACLIQEVTSVSDFIIWQFMWYTIAEITILFQGCRTLILCARDLECSSSQVSDKVVMVIVYAHGRTLYSNRFRHGSTTISYPQCSSTLMRKRCLRRCRKQSFAIRAYKCMPWALMA